MVSDTAAENSEQAYHNNVTMLKDSVMKSSSLMSENNGSSVDHQMNRIEHILEMHENSSETAALYVVIILLCYIFGLILLLLHHVKSKYGQITLYDLYTEIFPSCLTGVEGNPGNNSIMSNAHNEEEEEEIFADERDSYSYEPSTGKSRRSSSLAIWGRRLRGLFRSDSVSGKNIAMDLEEKAFQTSDLITVDEKKSSFCQKCSTQNQEQAREIEVKPEKNDEQMKKKKILTFAVMVEEKNANDCDKKNLESIHNSTNNAIIVIPGANVQIHSSNKEGGAAAENSPLQLEFIETSL